MGRVGVNPSRISNDYATGAARIGLFFMRLLRPQRRRKRLLVDPLNLRKRGTRSIDAAMAEIRVQDLKDKAIWHIVSPR